MFKKKIKLKEIVSKRQLNRRINSTLQSEMQVVCNNSMRCSNSCPTKSMQIDNSYLNHSLHFENNCFDNPLQVDNSCPSNNILEVYDTTNNILQLTTDNTVTDNISQLTTDNTTTEHITINYR